tara:strand:- start:1087 stop:2085 length:999 start_codon:yes stop_codon:yes gene_type:complete
MSYTKAADLLRFAEMASSSYEGVSLRDLSEAFNCDHRTSQRMTRAFENVFPQAEVFDDSERRRRWRLPRIDPRWLQAQGLSDSDLAALDMATKRAERDGATDEAERIRVVRDRMLSAMPSLTARRTETDAEALLEAQGFASRPGPQVATDKLLLGTLTEAFRAPLEIDISYRGAQDVWPKNRTVQPYGLLLGTRRYLVARPTGGDGQMRRFRLDRIENAVLTSKSFQRDRDFDLSAFAARSFGSFDSEAEFGLVVWRFHPEAAETARQFIFHPTQKVTTETDGSLTVQFQASGHLEMAWHLYQWGDQVDVLEPKILRELVTHHQRDDFAALP